jgi:hypothetical protein
MAIIAMWATPVFGLGGGQVRAAAETATTLPPPAAAAGDPALGPATFQPAR